MDKMKFILIFLLISCGNLFYYPTEKNYYSPSQFNVDYQEHFIEMYHGSVRYFHLIPKKKKRKFATIIFFHGNADNISGHFRQMIPFVKQGYDILMFDYIGYGKTSGNPNRDAIYHQSQLVLTKAFEFHQNLENKKFIVYGQSLGGNIAYSAVANNKVKTNVDLLVIDASFLSYKKIGFSTLTSHWATFLLSPLAFILVDNDYAAVNYIEKNKEVSTLVIHSRNDEIIPFKFGEEFFKNIKGKKKFLPLNSSCHLCNLKELKASIKVIETVNGLL
jgi:fermentation-respiration switch protein FrsA (DUF1100 family)